MLLEISYPMGPKFCKTQTERAPEEIRIRERNGMELYWDAVFLLPFHFQTKHKPTKPILMEIVVL